MSEQLICADPRLSAMDERLAALARAGKNRAANPRAYQRALDDAWLVRQKCRDAACVENWYAKRIAELSAAQEAPAAAERRVAQATPRAPLPPAVAAAPAASTERGQASAAPARPSQHADTPNVKPGAPLRGVGEELGFDIPLTRKEFLARFGAAGGKCGVSEQLAGMRALAAAVQSDCWVAGGCPAPTAGLTCTAMRAGYDGQGRVVAFSTTLEADGAGGLEKLVARFAGFSGTPVRSSEAANGRTQSVSGARGPFRMQAQVGPATGGTYSATFSLATR